MSRSMTSERVSVDVPVIGSILFKASSRSSRRLSRSGHGAGPVDERRQRTNLRAVVRFPALVTPAHQTGLLEDAEVLGDDRLGDAGAGRDRAYGLLSFPAQPLKDGAACGIRECGTGRPEPWSLGLYPAWLLLRIAGTGSG